MQRDLPGPLIVERREEARTAKQLIETLREDIEAVCCQGPHHAGEGRNGLRSFLGFRVVRDFASDHSLMQPDPLRRGDAQHAHAHQATDVRGP